MLWTGQGGRSQSLVRGIAVLWTGQGGLCSAPAVATQWSAGQEAAGREQGEGLALGVERKRGDRGDG